MKIYKFILAISVFLIVPFLSGNVVFAEYTKVFKISAYYSPLPCQDRYATGAYESDIRLNGNGTNGADGTEVYPGMIAAPKNFSFGTKLYIPGFGTGTVHDRGGAIVSSNGENGSYDRLDIWMGYGDAGLTRALNWGKRNVEVTVYGLDSSIADNVSIPGFVIDEKNPDCSNSVVSNSNNSILKNEPVLISSTAKTIFVENTYGVQKDALFYQGLMKGDINSEVKRLQNELFNLNLYKKSANGVFDETTMHAVFKFQQSQEILNAWTDIGAGYFGPTTRERLNEIISMRNENKILIAEKNSKDSTIALK